MRRRQINRKKFFRFLFVLTAIIVVLVVIISSCSLLTGRTLKIGLYESSAPLTFLDDKKVIAGFEAEYARMLAGKLKRKPILKLLEPEALAEALDNGTIDCVVSVRQSVHDYINEYQETSPFIAYGTVIVKAPGDETINGEDDLRGKKLGVLVNSDAELLCEEFLKRLSFNVRKYDVEKQPFQDLKLRENDAVLADELYARFLQIEDPESYQVLEDIYDIQQYGLRISKKLSVQFAGEIEGAIYALRADIALRDLSLLWFGAELN